MRAILGAIIIFVFCTISAVCSPAATWPQPGPLAEARASYQELTTVEWKFQTDPAQVGAASGWARTDFADDTWPTIHAGATWNAQGYDYVGDAWYRTRVWVPAEWQGSVVRFECDGVGDEYDVFAQGQWVRHQGGGDFGSIYAWQTHTEVQSVLTYGAWNTIAVRVTNLGWSAGGGLWRRVALRRIPPLEKFSSLIPEPIIDGHPEWKDLYWKTWSLLWENLSYGNKQNGWASAFLEENFNEQIYQWDSCFMTFFARYALELFPVMATLDNFYSRQRDDGYIQRSYSETTGLPAETPSGAEPAVNPPLYAWAELEYARFSGDRSRLARVLPVLEKYFAWIKANLRGPAGRGLYFQTQLGSGMDNTPRGDSDGAAWVDMSMQQALAARSLAEISTLVRDPQRARAWQAEYDSMKLAINQLLWNEHDAYYYDLQRSGEQAGVRHIGAFWALVAGIPTGAQAAGFTAHLHNADEFHRANLFPTLAATDPNYDLSGAYWRGSVWAPTNYMTIKGLEAYGDKDLAHEASVNYLNLMAHVYNADLDPSRISGLDRVDGPLRTLWECYAPESDVPCSPGHDQGFARANFVGWSGLGPVALLIENVIGIKANGLRNEIEWDLRELTRIGIRNFAFGRHGSKVTLIAEVAKENQRRVSIASSKPFTLTLHYRGRTRVWKIRSGRRDLTL